MTRVILVPGGEILPVNVLAPNTKERVKKAMTLWKSGCFDRIVFSGGIAQSPHIQTKTQAFLMFKYFIGLKEASGFRIVVERMALDSYENIKLSMRALSDTDNPKITVVSQWQHLLRLRISFRAIHPEIPVEFVRAPGKVYFKEFLFLAYTLYDPRGVKWLARKNREARKR